MQEEPYFKTAFTDHKGTGSTGYNPPPSLHIYLLQFACHCRSWQKPPRPTPPETCTLGHCCRMQRSEEVSCLRELKYVNLSMNTNNKQLQMFRVCEPTSHHCQQRWRWHQTGLKTWLSLCVRHTQRCAKLWCPHRWADWDPPPKLREPCLLNCFP